MDRVLVVLTFAAAIGSGLIAGVFYAFSTFVMKALTRIPPAHGMAAMQSINIAVINPLFLGVFLGTALISAATTVLAMTQWGRAGCGYLLAGSLLYLIGTFGVTMFFNVPLNNMLAGLSPEDPTSGDRWAEYVSRWNVWNHVRTAAAGAAMVLDILALQS